MPYDSSRFSLFGGSPASDAGRFSLFDTPAYSSTTGEGQIDTGRYSVINPATTKVDPPGGALGSSLLDATDPMNLAKPYFEKTSSVPTITKGRRPNANADIASDDDIYEIIRMLLDEMGIGI